ncbi:MAG: diguanylate cyclase [Eubacteriales bacterium]|nr:diguanylate cyclase [Eubacteriales bacterium]
MNRLINKFYLVAIVVAIIISIGMFAEFNYLENTVKQETQKIIELERNYKASVIDNHLIWKGQMIKDASIFIATNSGDEAILAYLKALMDNNPSFLSIYYGTASNRMINASGWIPPASFDLRTRPWYIKATSEKKLVYTEAFLNASGDQWILTVAQPVYNQNLQLLGVVAGDISIRNILDIINLSETTDNGYSFLIDSKGKILAHPNYPYELPDETIALKDISEILSPSLIVGEEGIEETVVDGQKGFLAYRTISNTDFILGSFIEITGIMKHSEQIWIIFLIATSSTIIVFLLLFIIQRKYIIKPIMSLNQDILSIPVGGEIDYEISMDEQDIFFELKQTVNSLLIKIHEYFDKIKESQATLVQKNKELEESFLLRESMLEISQSIMKTEGLDRIYEIILINALKSIKHAKLGTIMIKEGDYFKVASYIGFERNSIEDFNIPIEDSFLYKATGGAMDRLVRIDDVKAFDSFYFIKTTDNENEFIQSTIIAPIYVDQELYGVVSLDSLHISNFDDNDEKVMAFIQSNIEIAITKHLMFEKTLYLSRYDGLTDLYNRNYFEEFFITHREKALRYDEHFNIVIFDINKLKYVNDHFGHLAGDAVIVEFSKKLSGIVRKSDIIARYAGDEFMGMFFNSEKNALHDRLIQFLNEMENSLIQLSNASIFCTFSFGIAEFGVDGTELDQLLRIADERMYRFKSEYFKY